MACSGNDICIFSSNYPPYVGGLEAFTQNLAAELVYEGYGATVVTNNTFDLASHETLDSGVEIARLPCHPLMNRRMPVPRKNGEYRKLVQELKSRDWRGVLVNTRFYLHSLLGVEVAESCGVRPLVLDHGSAYLTLGNPVLDVPVKAWEHIITGVVKRHDVDFYGISKKSCEWLKTFGVEAKGVLGNSIDAESFRESASSRDFRREFEVPDGVLVVSFTGRLIPEKGVDVLLGAMGSLADAPIVLLMAGTGPLEGKVKDTHFPNVKLVGKLERSDVAALLLQSDLFCLPTRSEGFSTSLLEASACGVPSLVTHVGGSDELIPSEEYGNVMDYAPNPGSLARELSALEQNRAKLKRQGICVRERTEQLYSWNQTVKVFIDACDRANDRLRR